MDWQTLIFGVYPYVALTVFLLGSWIRFDTEQYTWKSDSSQLLSKKGMRLFSNLFHVGVLVIFFGHLLGLLIPHPVFRALGISDMAHQYLAIVAGAIFGALAFIGGAGLWLRRMTNRRVRSTGRRADINILSWIMLTLMVGLSTLPVSLGHAARGDAEVLSALADWVQSIIYLHPNPGYLANVNTIYKVHIFLGMSVFLFFPFTRLVHIWSAPLGYIGRTYQIVRSKRAPVAR